MENGELIKEAENVKYKKTILIRPLQVAFRFLVRTFSSQDAGGVFIHYVIIPLSIMTTKIHSGKTVRTKKCKAMHEYTQ